MLKLIFRLFWYVSSHGMCFLKRKFRFKIVLVEFLLFSSSWYRIGKPPILKKKLSNLCIHSSIVSKNENWCVAYSADCRCWSAIVLWSLRISHKKTPWQMLNLTLRAILIQKHSLKVRENIFWSLFQGMFLLTVYCCKSKFSASSNFPK